MRRGHPSGNWKGRSSPTPASKISNWPSAAAYNDAQKGTGKKSWLAEELFEPADRLPVREFCREPLTPLAAAGETTPIRVGRSRVGRSRPTTRAAPSLAQLLLPRDRTLFAELVDTVRVLPPLDRNRFRGALPGLAVGEAVEDHP